MATAIAPQIASWTGREPSHARHPARNDQPIATPVARTTGAFVAFVVRAMAAATAHVTSLTRRTSSGASMVRAAVRIATVARAVAAGSFVTDAMTCK